MPPVGFVALLVAAATPDANAGVHVEQVGALPVAVHDAAVADLVRALAGVAHLNAVLDDNDSDSACSEPNECAQRVRVRTGAREIVIVKLLGGALGARCIAFRIRADRSSPDGPPAETDLRYDAVSFRPSMDRLVADLFPERIDAHPEGSIPAIAAVTPRATARVARPLPWIVLGASAVAAGVGIALGVSSAKAIDSLADAPHAAAEYRDIQSRASTRAIAADVLFVAAAAGAVLGIALFFDE